MLIGTRFGIVCASTAILALAVPASAGSPAVFKGWPTYVQIRGGGLDSVITLHHGPLLNARVTMEDSPIIAIYEGVRGGREEVPASLEGRYYEVAEFWDKGNWPIQSVDGPPFRPLVFEEATVFSRIYPDEDGGPVWNAWDGMGTRIIRANGEEQRGVYIEIRDPGMFSPRPYRQLSQGAVDVLARHGLEFVR